MPLHRSKWGLYFSAFLAFKFKGHRIGRLLRLVPCAAGLMGELKMARGGLILSVVRVVLLVVVLLLLVVVLVLGVAALVKVK